MSSLREVVDYLRRNGASDESIRSTLLALGYSEEEVEEALSYPEEDEVAQRPLEGDVAERIYSLEGDLLYVRRKLEQLEKKVDIALKQPALVARVDKLEARLDAVIRALRDYAPHILRKLDEP